MADVDLDFADTNVSTTNQSQGVRKNISLKLKGKGRGRGRRGQKTTPLPKKAERNSSGPEEDEDEEENNNEAEELSEPSSEKAAPDTTKDVNEVISKLEAPSFSPMERAFPEALHQNKKLRWDHKLNLIGEKVMNPMIHCCEKCTLPILNYGRMIPCKHVFCYECAQKTEKCLKCDESVTRVEQTALGTVFMCTFGGTRYGPVTCGRTYLSQRDLQAHINYRHIKPPATTANTAISTTSSSGHTVQSVTAVAHHPVARDPRDPRAHAHEPSLSQQSSVVSHSHSHSELRDQEHSRSPALPAGSPVGPSRQYPHSPANYPSSIPVSSARPNLITVPIQDDSLAAPVQHTHSAHASPYTPPASTAPSHALPPLQHPPSYQPQPPHAYQHPLPVPAPPPITNQPFTQHPQMVHHPPPPIRAPGAPMYSTPPPVHHPPPATYSTPPQGAPPPHGGHPLPPQCFPAPGSYDENAYMSQWSSGGVPAPARAPIPPVGGHNMGLGPPPPRGPVDPNFRPPYYQ